MCNIERLSGDYIRGYTKAIQDITDVFDYIRDDLRRHNVRFNSDTANKLLKTCLMHREQIREDMNGFIRWNANKKDFEWYTNTR